MKSTVTSNSVDWVSNKLAFLTLYISQLSFPFLLHLLPLFSFPAALYFLLTDDACLDQHSLRETYGRKDVFIEKLRRYRSGNLTVTMGNTKRRICETWIFAKRSVELFELHTFTKVWERHVKHVSTLISS